jgi:hypothetical protein
MAAAVDRECVERTGAQMARVEGVKIKSEMSR